MATNGKMIILRGNADLNGTSYPDESGKMVKWPHGALHVEAAKGYAVKRDYEPIVFDIGGYPQGPNSPQSTPALELIRKDAEVHGLYGFSGGGYNVRHILRALADNTPAVLPQIKLVVVIGSPNKSGNDALYKPAVFGTTASWELVFRCNPSRDMMPKGLASNVPTHMFGPDVLLSGWPEANMNC